MMDKSDCSAGIAYTLIAQNKDWIEANTELVSQVAQEVLSCFRSVHRKLKQLPIGAVNDLAQSIAVWRHCSAKDPSPWDRRDHPSFRPALDAWHDAGNLAARLVRAIARIQEHSIAVWGDIEAPAPDDELPQLAIALERAFQLVNAPKPHAPWSEWRVIVGLHSKLVLEVLRTNGFPNASMKSEAGPAPEVMANLVHLLMGERSKTLTAKTIAREMRKAEERRLKREAGKKS